MMDRLEAVVAIEVHVGGAEDVDVLTVVQVDDLLEQAPLVVVIADRQHADDVFPVPVLPLVLHDLLPDQIANELGSGRRSHSRYQPADPAPPAANSGSETLEAGDALLMRHDSTPVV